MEKQKLERINALARKSRTEELTPEEKAEQFSLRSEYIGEFRSSLKNTLDNTYIQKPDGTREKLQQKPGKTKH